MRYLIGVFSCCLLAAEAFGAGLYADGAWIPPKPKTGAVSEAALPEAILETCIDAASRYHVFERSPKQGSVSERSGKGEGPLRAGEEIPVDLAGEELFGDPVQIEGRWVHVAGVVSVGAEALRLQVDFTAVSGETEVWVVAPNERRALGPHRVDARRGPRRWLSLIPGEETLLVALSPESAAPPLRLISLSHIFLSFQEIAKQLRCNLDLACETDPAIINAATATAVIAIGSEGFCSGTLVNNERTPGLEPFFLTANHCICEEEQAEATEAYWDFRSSSCGANDAPNWLSLPRSQGMALLTTSYNLDITLIALDRIPDGDYGRAVLGWDARRLSAGTSILALHYPQADYNRISKGRVVSIDQDFNGRENQIKVHWEEGVTEQGSSGSCLLIADTLRIAGTLSQGPTHSCSDISQNVDWFASFSEFHAAAGKYLDAEAPSTAFGQSDCEGDGLLTKVCPFKLLYANHPGMLGKFRILRDKGLVTNPVGRYTLRIYESVAPWLARALEKSAAARSAFLVFTAPLANLAEPLPR